MYMKQTFALLLVLSGLCACHHLSLDEKWQQQWDHYTHTQCPRRIDEGTVLDSVTYTFGEERLFTRYMTVDSVADGDSVCTPELVEQLRQVLLLDIRGDLQFRRMREAGVTFRCLYYSKKHPGLVRLDMVFRPEDYNQRPTDDTDSLSEQKNKEAES